MKLESVKIKDLKPLENNVRRHNEKQIEELERSLKQFGQTRAMVIDEENNILIGNGLYYALVKMGQQEAFCYRKTGLDEKTKKKLILSDNKTYSLGSDNYEEIQNYINEITGVGDFDIPGFDEYILEQMTATNEEIEEVVQNYGTITDDKLNENQVEQVNNIVSNSIPNNDNKQPSTIVTETKTGQEKERKYIICPSCGEVIYLD